MEFSTGITVCAVLANIATAVNFFFAKRQSENSDAMIKEMKAQAALSKNTVNADSVFHVRLSPCRRTLVMPDMLWEPPGRKLSA